jgi:hypothetical protein
LQSQEIKPMVATKTLHVSPESELGVLLHDALEAGEPVIIDTGDAVYRLDVESTARVTDQRRRPSPGEVERSRAGVREAAGSWRDIDADALKAYIRERRQTANRPPVEL